MQLFSGNIQHVTTTEITLALQESVILSRLLNYRYYPLRVSAHSLRASVATEMRLNNVGEYLIKNSGTDRVPRG